MEEHLKAIILACKELGWEIAIPNVEGEEELQGLVIGTRDYIDHILLSDE